MPPAGRLARFEANMRATSTHNRRKIDRPIDQHIGKRIRMLRFERQMSQSELATAMDMSFQQIQKYEKGANRVSAATLYKLAELFDVPIASFFPDNQSAVVEPEADREATAKEVLRALSGLNTEGQRLLLNAARSFGASDALRTRVRKSTSA